VVSWPAATAASFIYVAIAALVRPGVGATARRTVFLAALVGAAAGWGSGHLAAGLLRTWIVPPIFLLHFYWTTGRLFVRPMPTVESWLLAMDRVLRIRQTAAHLPVAIGDLLEFAYASVYALIPAALAVHLALSVSPDADRFWTVILVTDYICFGVLPWIQTRPPRALEGGSAWRSRMRGFNERMLDSASIHVNTFPSGHAAEAMAAALLVVGAPLPFTAVIVVAALAVSAGAVYGRYHYAADAILGWVVALAVWRVV
jgi:hypothetical protein